MTSLAEGGRGGKPAFFLNSFSLERISTNVLAMICQAVCTRHLLPWPS